MISAASESTRRRGEYGMLGMLPPRGRSSSTSSASSGGGGGGGWDEHAGGAGSPRSTEIGLDCVTSSISRGMAIAAPGVGSFSLMLSDADEQPPARAEGCWRRHSTACDCAAESVVITEFNSKDDLPRDVVFML